MAKGCQDHGRHGVHVPDRQTRRRVQGAAAEEDLQLPVQPAGAAQPVAAVARRHARLRDRVRVRQAHVAPGRVRRGRSPRQPRHDELLGQLCQVRKAVIAFCFNFNKPNRLVSYL